MSQDIFIILVLMVAIGHVAATYWSGHRLQVPVRQNLRDTFTLVVAVSGILWLSTAAARSGLLLRFDAMPPYVLRFIAPHIMFTMILSRSPFGRRLATGLPLSVLIGFQGFRIVVELLLQRFYLAGLIPVQITFEGRNFDILSGLTAIPVAWLAARGRAPRWMLYAWNLLGLGLLINIVGTAIVSMPGPLRLFTNGPANQLIASWPYIWLPTFLVTTALMGHLLVFRRLGEEANHSRTPVPTVAQRTPVADWDR